MIPLFTIKQVRGADGYAINSLGIPGIILMENASLSITDALLSSKADLNTFDKIGIVSGKGNNGGDGFAVARHLINEGFFVYVVFLGKENQLRGDALSNFTILKNLIRETKRGKIIFFKKPNDIDLLNECSVIIDALLGSGYSGDLKEPFLSVIEKLNGINAYKVAIDIPSGLNSDTGFGDTIFEADLTVTLAELKRGLFFGKGYAFSGEVIKGDIGIGGKYFDKLNVDDYCIEPEDAFNGLPVKYVDDHKYSSGKVLTIAGSDSFPGAAFFTANSTQKIGAGASILAFPDSMKNLAFTKLDSSTLLTYDDEDKGFITEKNLEELKQKIDWADVVALGPGLGRDEKTLSAMLKILKLNRNKKFVIDADAIYALRGKKYLSINLNNSVLTPHHHEFADLLGISVDELRSDLLFYGKKFTRETGAVLVLKGAPTIIFTSEGEALINTTGNPGMAKFGTGDVLTGVIAGLIAQNKTIENSVITGVYLHSLAGDLLHEQKTVYGFTATDLMNELPNAITLLAKTILQNT